MATAFITPATAAKWDDGRRTSFVEHVAAKVMKCKTREETDELLHMELYELLREGMAGSIAPDQVGLAIKEVMHKSSLTNDHLEDVVGDLLWLLGEEATLDAKESKVDLKTAIAPVVQEILSSGVSADVMKARVSEEGLEAAGLIKSSSDAKNKLQRLRTNKFYAQQKFNLLREESEGYSKLMVDLEHGCAGVGSEKNVERLSNNVMSLIAYFNLDPNRVLDVMLDCLEGAVQLPQHSVEAYVHLIRKFNRSALVQVLGFKFQGHQQTNQKPPESLYQLVAVLCKHKALSIKDMYPFLSSSDDDMLAEFNKFYEVLLKHIERMRIKVIGKGNPNDPEQKEATIDAAPHADTGGDNQKLLVTAALLAEGDWESAEHMLTVLALLLPASFPPISGALCTLIHTCIAPVYDKIMDANGLSAVLTKQVKAPALDDSMQTDASPDAAVPVIRDIKDFPKIMPLFRHLTVYVAHDAVLYMKLCRILREYMVATKGAACDSEFCKDMLQSLLGALVLLPSNASAANYLWECFKELPYLQRYWIYSEMQYKTYIMHPQLLLARAQCREDMRKHLKSMTKENVRKKRNQLGQMSHSQPVIVCEVMLDQAQEFESMIDVCKEGLHYCSTLSLDILSYLLIEELGGSVHRADKPLVLDDDTNLGRWLLNLATFAADMYLKHPRVEMQGLLQHIFNRLAGDSFAELHVLRELFSTMGGIKYDVSTVATEDIHARSGGERLRLATEFPWPTDALFNKALAEGEMGMGKEGGAKQMKDYQSAKKEREEATKWLIHNLNTSGLAVPMIVKIGQQISGCLLSEGAISAKRVKYSSWLHKQCQHTLLVYVDFLWRRMPVGEYCKRLPSPLELVEQLKLEPTLALLIQRPGMRWNDPASVLDLSVYAKDLIAATPQNLKSNSPLLYTCFWSLTLNDIFVPHDCYDVQMARLKKALTDLEDTQRLDPKAKDKDIKKWKENLALDLDKMEKEMKKQIENKKKIQARIEKEKASLVAAEKSYRTVPQFFLQTCIFPRCVQSPEDAVYCAKFIKLLHHIKTPNLSTILTYNMIISSFGPMVFSRTEQEAKHLGMFLSEMLGTLNSWGRDEALFKRECDLFPGFLNIANPKKDKKDSADDKPSKDDKKEKKEEPITFASYQQCVKNWHKKLSEAFCTCLESMEGVEVHNALTILSVLVQGTPLFPIHDTYHADVKGKVSRMTDDSQHAFGNSITVMARSINGRLQMCQDKMQKGPKKKTAIAPTAATAPPLVPPSASSSDLKKLDSKKDDRKEERKEEGSKEGSKEGTSRHKPDDSDRVRKRSRGEEEGASVSKSKEEQGGDSRTVRAKKDSGSTSIGVEARGARAPDAKQDISSSSKQETSSSSKQETFSKSTSQRADTKTDNSKTESVSLHSASAKRDDDKAGLKADSIKAKSPYKDEKSPYKDEKSEDKKDDSKRGSKEVSKDGLKEPDKHGKKEEGKREDRKEERKDEGKEGKEDKKEDKKDERRDDKKDKKDDKDKHDRKDKDDRKDNKDHKDDRKDPRDALSSRDSRPDNKVERGETKRERSPARGQREKALASSESDKRGGSPAGSGGKGGGGSEDKGARDVKRLRREEELKDSESSKPFDSKKAASPAGHDERKPNADSRPPARPVAVLSSSGAGSEREGARTVGERDADRGRSGSGGGFSDIRPVHGDRDRERRGAVSRGGSAGGRGAR